MGRHSKPGDFGESDDRYEEENTEEPYRSITQVEIYWRSLPEWVQVILAAVAGIAAIALFVFIIRGVFIFIGNRWPALAAILGIIWFIGIGLYFLYEKEQDAERDKQEKEHARLERAAELEKQRIIQEAAERERRRQAWKEDAMWVMDEVEREYKRKGK